MKSADAPRTIRAACKEGRISTKTKIWLGISIGVVIVAAVLFVLFFYKPTLTVRTNPGDAQVTLAGQAIQPGTPLRLAPGTYEIIVKREGYLTTRHQVDLGISQIVDLPIELRQIPAVQQLTGGVAEPALTPDQEAIVYLGRDGKQFFRVDTEVGADGATRAIAISGERFANIANVYWSPARNLVIYQTSQGHTKLFDFERYDLLNQTELDLGANLRGLSWHPTQEVIAAYRHTPEGERSLVRINVATNETDRLVDLRDLPLSNPKVYWSPDGRTIALVEQAVYLVDVTNRRLATLANSAGVTDLRWNPVRPLLIAEVGQQLRFLPTDGSASDLPAIRTPLAKAAWTADGGALLVALATDTNRDRFESVNLTDDMTTRYRYQSTYPVAATNLLPIGEADKLYFTTDGTLYSLVLEPEADER